MNGTSSYSTFQQTDEEDDARHELEDNISIATALYPLLDALDEHWPTFFVSIGMFLELFQHLALIINHVFPWGSVMSGIAIPIYATIIPIWDQNFLLSTAYTINSAFAWVSFAVIFIITALNVYYIVTLRGQRVRQVPFMFRLVVFLITGPFFLPMMHQLLSLCVCFVKPYDVSDKTDYLAAYPSRKCFKDMPYTTTMFSVSILSLLTLTATKTIITLMVYDDQLLTISPRGRTHNTVETWWLIYQLCSAVLFHYLPSVGQRETFAGLFATGSFIVMVLHAFYLPFLNFYTNRLRVVFLGCIFYCGLVAVITLELADKSFLYHGSNWDCLILFAGCALTGILCYRIAEGRISFHYKRDMARALHGQTDGEKQRLRMRFPWYLPQEERTNYTEDKVFAKPESNPSNPLAYDGTSRDPAFRDNVSGNNGNDMWDTEEIEELVDFTMASYLDSIYVVTDIEAASRFCAELQKATSTQPSQHAVGFASRIYAKGLNRFAQDDWLRLQYATFLLTFANEKNALGLSIMDSLNKRQLGTLLAYRLHRHIHLIKIATRETNRSKKALATALSYHREALTNVNGFWKKLAADQIGVTQLGQIAFTIIEACHGGLRHYTRTLSQHVDSFTLTRYAQFLDHVVLDSDSAENLREMAVDYVEKSQLGLQEPEVSTRAMVDSSNVLGGNYSSLSRTLRTFLLAIGFLVLLVLVGMFLLIFLTYEADKDILMRIHQACLCRLYTLRSLWATRMAIANGEWDASWSTVRQDLTSLREANAAITYAGKADTYSLVVAVMQMPLFTYFYNVAGLYENMGTWRAGMLYISSLETIILKSTSDDDREEKYRMLVDNDLSGAAAAYNQSLISYVDQSANAMQNSTIALIVLYILGVILILVMFFVFRCFLTRISGIRLSALGLFRLIPQTALQGMIEKMDHRIETFDAPDPVFTEMLQNRGLIEKPSSDGEGADPNAAKTSAPAVRKKVTVGGVENSRDAEDDGAPTSKFDSLLKNSTVADVGRLKIGQGQYEAPHAKGSYMARVLTPEEAAEKQRIIDDAEVEESFVRVQNHEEDPENERVIDEVRRLQTTVTATSPTLRHRMGHLVLGIACVVFSVLTAIFAVHRYMLIEPGANAQIDSAVVMQEGVATLAVALICAERMVYAPSMDALTELHHGLSDLRMLDIYLSSVSDQSFSADFASFLSRYRVYFKQAHHQAMVAAYLSCLANMATITDLTCDTLSSIDWGRDEFIPTPFDHLIFDANTLLPSGRVDDLDATDAEKTEIANNILSSNYYNYLKETMRSFFLRAKSTLEDEILEEVQNTADVNNGTKKFLIAFACLLLVGTLLQLIQGHLRFPEKYFLLACTGFSCAAAIAVVVLAGIVYNRPVPNASPYPAIVMRLKAVEAAYSLYYQSRRESNLAAFAAVELGAVNFIPDNDRGTVRAWSNLFNLMGEDYFPEINNAFKDIQYCHFLDSIVVVLGCNYNSFNPEICALPHLASVDWDLDDETYGYRLQQTYQGTTQLLYSTRTKDLAKTLDEQKELSVSLAFGALRAQKHADGVEGLVSTLKAFVCRQAEDAKQSSKSEKPLIYTILGLCALILIIEVGLLLILSFLFMEEHSVRTGLRTTAGSSVSTNGIRDRSFTHMVNRTAVVVGFFLALLTALFILVMYSMLSDTNDAAVMDAATLSNAAVVHSGINMQSSVDRRWVINSAYYFADWSVKLAQQYYALAYKFFTVPLLNALFGPTSISTLRYDEDVAVNTSTDGFTDAQTILAFGGVVDLSQRRWRQRVLYLTVAEHLRTNLDMEKYGEMFTLTEHSEDATEILLNNMLHRAKIWLIIHLTIYSVTLLLYLCMLYYFLVPVVRRLMKEEEGTQVMLRMIPPDVRHSVPAIAEYMATGRIVQDANIVEVDTAAKEFSVLPTITINSHGIILEMSRAAEEAFLWTKSEAIGRNVNIFMPDNVASEHDHYITRYIQTGVQTVINNSRLMRAKRKDGTLFPAILQVQEMRSGNSLNFVGVIRNCADDLELERGCNLSLGLTDAFTTAIIVADTAGVILKFSKSAEMTFRCSEDDVVGRKVNCLMPRFEADSHDHYIERYLQTHRKSSIDETIFVRAKRFNGEIFPAYLTLREYKRGGQHNFIAYLEDMTERLHVEMIAAAGNTTKTKSPTPLIIGNSDGKMVFVSESASRIFGYTEEEMLKQSVSMLLEEPLATQHQSYYATFLRRHRSNRHGFVSGDARVIEGPARRRESDGSMSTFQARITLKSFSAGKRGEHVLAMIEDVSKKQTMLVKAKLGSAIVACSAIPIFLITDSGLITQMNPAAEDMFRTIAAAAYGKSIFMLFNNTTNYLQETSSASTNADKNPIEQMIEEYKKTGTSSRLGRNVPAVAHTLDEDRKSFSVEVTMKEILEEGSTLFLVYIRDTSHDLLLLETSQWNEAIMSVSSTPIVCTTLDGVIFSCSDSACDQFNWKREELISKNLSTLLPTFSSRSGDGGAGHPTEGSGYQQHLQRETILLGRSRSGEEFPVAMLLRDIHIEGAEPFLVASLRNCTTEVGLNVQRRLDRIMAEISPIPFICITATGIITEFSRAAEEHFGYKSQEVVGQNVKILMPEEIGSKHDGYLRSYEKTGVKHVIDNTRATFGRHRDGTVFPIELCVKEVRNNDVVEFISYARDLSETKALELTVEANRIVSELAAIPMFELSLDGTITRTNKFVAEEFRVPESDNLVGRSIYDMIPNTTVEENGETVNQSGWLEQGKTTLDELDYNSNRKGQSTSLLGQVDSHFSHSLSRQAQSVYSVKDGHPAPPIATSVQEVLGRRRNGEVFRCEVSLARVVEIHKTGSTINCEQRLVMYARNLTSDFELRLQNEVNTATIAISPTPVLCIDHRGNISQFSRAAEEVLGYTVSEAVGKNFTMLLAADDAERYAKMLSDFHDTGIGILSAAKEPTRMQLRRKGAGCVLVEVSVKEVVDGGSSGSSFIVYMRDLSTLMATEAEIATHDALTRESPLAVLVTDHQGTLVECSEAAEKLLRFRPVEMIGKNVDFLRARPMALGELASNGAETLEIDDDGGDFFTVNMQYREGQPKSIHDRVWVRCGDGVVVSAEVHIQAVLPYRTQYPRFVAYVQSLEKTIATAPELREASRMFEATPSAVLVMNLDGTVLRCNNVAAALLRYKPSQLVNVTAGRLFGNGNADSILSQMHKHRSDTSSIFAAQPPSGDVSTVVTTTATGTGVSYGSSTHSVVTMESIPMIRKDDKEVYVNATLTFIPGVVDGDEPQAVFNFTDVSEEHQTRKHLAKESALEDQEGMCAVEFDLEGNFLHVSQRFADQLGSPVEDFLGHPYTTFAPRGYVVSAFIHKAQNTIKSGGTVASEHHTFLFRSRGGSVIKMSGEMYPVMRQDGTLSSVFAELLLPRHMDSYISQVGISTLSLSSDAIVLVSGTDGTILCSNAAATKLFVVPSHLSLVGTKITRLVPSAGLMESLQQNADSGELLNTMALTFDERLPASSVPPSSAGVTFTQRTAFSTTIKSHGVEETRGGNNGGSKAASRSSRHQHHQQHPMLLLCLHSTEQKRELLKQKRAIDVALDFSFHATIVMNVAGHIEVFSRVAENLFGVPADVAMNREMVALLLHPEEAAKVRQAFAVFRRTGQADVLETARQIKANRYGPGSGPGELGNVVGSVDVELVIHQLHMTAKKSQYEYVAFLITK